VCAPGCHGRKLEIAGWVLGAERRVAAVEITAQGTVLARVSVKLPRPDVLAAYPGAAGAEACGFHAQIGAAQPPRQGVQLVAVLADQERVPFAAIGCWESLPPDDLPLVSVVIPCFRQAHFLHESIGSVLEQLYARLEIVVVDDGSPDNTAAVVRRYPGVRYLRQSNAGLGAARNVGFRECHGDYVLFLDADDRLLPVAIAAAVEQFRVRSDLGLVAGHFRMIGLDGRVIASPVSRAGGTDDYLSLLRDYYIGPPGVMLFRREALDALRAFDVVDSPAADYDIALRAAQNFPIHVHGEVVLEYRRHGANMTADPGVMLSSTMAVMGRHRKHAARLPGGRDAYLAGVEHWRRSWGELLLRKTASDLVERRLRSAFRGLRVLLRYHPGAFPRVLREIRKHERADREPRA
jgi:glycosyltransferase involved in cell wall biosynthesis